MIISGRPNEIAAWAAQRLQRNFSAPLQAIGVVRGHRMTGAVVFNGFEGRNMEVTAVGRSVFSRSVLRYIYKYVVEQNSCERISMTVHAENVKVINLALKMGATIEGRRTKWFGNSDAILLGLHKDDVPRWIKTPYNNNNKQTVNESHGERTEAS